MFPLNLSLFFLVLEVQLVFAVEEKNETSKSDPLFGFLKDSTGKNATEVSLNSSISQSHHFPQTTKFPPHFFPMRFAESESAFVKWPDKDPSDKLIDVTHFNNFISMYRFEGSQKYALYKLSHSDNTMSPIFDENDTEGPGWKIKYWQTSFDQKDYLIQINTDVLFILSLKEKEKLEIREGFKKLDDPTKAFVLGHLVFAEKDVVYDLKKAVNEKKVEAMGLGELSARGVYNLSEYTKEKIKEECFSLSKPLYCAPIFSSTYHTSGHQIIVVENDEAVLGFGEFAYMYVKCGEKAGLLKNKRCYFFLKDLLSGEAWFLPQDLLVNNMTQTWKGRTMLFPFVYENDGFLRKYFEAPNTTTSTSTTEKMTTPPEPTSEYHLEFKLIDHVDKNNSVSKFSFFNLFNFCIVLFAIFPIF